MHEQYKEVTASIRRKEESNLPFSIKMRGWTGINVFLLHRVMLLAVHQCRGGD